MSEELKKSLRYLRDTSALLGSIDDETWLKFEEYFCANPRVWTYFKRFATYAKAHNKRIGAKAIMERVRWECEFGESAAPGEFKVNNNYTAYFVRLLLSQCPEFKGFFELREIHGLKEAA